MNATDKYEEASCITEIKKEVLEPQFRNKIEFLGTKKKIITGAFFYTNVRNSKNIFSRDDASKNHRELNISPQNFNRSISHCSKCYTLKKNSTSKPNSIRKVHRIDFQIDKELEKSAKYIPNTSNKLVCSGLSFQQFRLINNMENIDMNIKKKSGKLKPVNLPSVHSITDSLGIISKTPSPYKHLSLTNEKCKSKEFIESNKISRGNSPEKKSQYKEAIPGFKPKTNHTLKFFKKIARRDSPLFINKSCKKVSDSVGKSWSEIGSVNGKLRSNIIFPVRLLRQ